MKTLALKFKYLGDVAVMIPSLEALKNNDPEGELHVLVPAEAAPIVEHLPFVTKVWRLPRRRGKMNLRESFPLLRELRSQRFDRSVDFDGNDRGAIWSRVIGARQRLGLLSGRGFLGRSKCFHQTVKNSPAHWHQAERDFSVLAPWNVAPPSSFEPKIYPDPALAAEVRSLPPGSIVCHLSTSQPKKEWPLSHWATLAELAAQEGRHLVFASGASPRERDLLEKLKTLAPDIATLETEPSLARYIVQLSQASLFISGDTGPLHFAAALGVPTIVLFGPGKADQWAPRGQQHICLRGVACTCSVHAAVCTAAAPCLAAITPEQVLEAIGKALPL